MAANDRYRDKDAGLVGPGDDAFAVTPSDSVDFTVAARALYVGVTGNVVVITKGGTAITFTAVPAGMILPIRCTRVNSTNTTATNIVGLV